MSYVSFKYYMHKFDIRVFVFWLNNFVPSRSRGIRMHSIGLAVISEWFSRPFINACDCFHLHDDDLVREIHFFNVQLGPVFLP